MGKKLSKRRSRSSYHTAPFKKEIAKHLLRYPRSAIHVDLTYGCGGYCELIMTQLPQSQIIAFEVDKYAVQCAKKDPNFNEQQTWLIHDNFIELDHYLSHAYINKCATIIIDLGYSDVQLANKSLGLSFRQNAPLNMNYQLRNNLTAAKIINEWPPKKLEKLLRDFGEERYAELIVKKICRRREDHPITTTFELVELIQQAVPSHYRRHKHPARKTFQALRIFLNNELVSLAFVLPRCLKYLKPRGQLFVITFNSLEDRIVKQFMRTHAIPPLRDKYFSPAIENNHMKYQLVNPKPYQHKINQITSYAAVRCAKLRILARKCQNKESV